MTAAALCSFTSRPSSAQTTLQQRHDDHSKHNLEILLLCCGGGGGGVKTFLRQNDCHNTTARLCTQHSCAFFHYKDRPCARVFLCRMTMQKWRLGWGILLRMCSNLWFYKYHPGHAKGGSGPAGKAQLQQCLWSDGVMQFWGANFVTKESGKRKAGGRWRRLTGRYTVTGMWDF